MGSCQKIIMWFVVVAVILGMFLTLTPGLFY